MLTLIIIFNTLGVWVLVCPAIFMDTMVNGNHNVMVDVAIALCWPAGTGQSSNKGHPLQ